MCTKIRKKTPVVLYRKNKAPAVLVGSSETRRDKILRAVLICEALENRPANERARSF